jgi:predicted amidohydrolase
MIISIAQTQPIKGDILKNINRHKELINNALSNNSDIIIFPELSLTGYEPELAESLTMTADDSRLDCLQDMSNEHHITIGIGMPMKTKNGISISMIIFQPHKTRQVYFKKYIHSSEIPFFIGGENDSTFIKDTTIALAICYEISVPQHAEDAFKNGANIYIASVVEDYVDNAIAKLSAMASKYKMTVLMSNAVGQTGAYLCDGKSSIWNTEGELLGQLDSIHEGLLIFNTTTQEVKSIKHLATPIPYLER